MLEFICGAKGSGKSSVIYKRIGEDLAAGKRVILLVPEQLSATAETTAVREARGISVKDLSISSFKRLSNTVLRTYGGLAYKYIDKGARVLVMWRVLSALMPFLEEYGGAEADAELSKLMLSAVNEFKTYGIDTGKLSEMARDKSIPEGPLKRKLNDLSLIYSAYEAEIKAMDYADTADDLKRLKEALDGRDYFKGCSVYADAFYGFTEEEYGVLEHIIRGADKFTVSVCTDPKRERLIFSGCERMKRELCDIAKRNSVEIGGDTLLETSLSSEKDALRYLGENLWEDGAAPYAGELSPIRIIECENAYAEAEAVAQDIARRVREGARYRDHTVIARNADAYEGIIDTELERYGIPCFMSRKEELKTKPVIKLIYSVLRIADGGFRRDDIISYIKTGLTGVDPYDCDVFENYLRLWNVGGLRFYDGDDWNMNPDGYSAEVSSYGSEILCTVNRVREKISLPLMKLYEKLKGRHTVKELTLSLYEFLEETEAGERCAEEEEGTALWNCLMGVFDSLVNSIGDTETDTKNYISLFSMLVEESSIGRIPQTGDEVLIGSADSLRTPYVKTVYLLGVCEGEFPGTAAENGIFTDAEKIFLENAGYRVSKNMELQNVDEMLYFYNALSCARESAVICYPVSKISGENLKPSSVLEWFEDRMGVKKENYSDRDIFSRVWSYEPAFELALRYPRDPAAKVLSKIYLSDESYRSRLEHSGISVTAEKESVSDALASEIFKDELIMSPSRLEKYVLCKFEYYCKYVLKIKEEEKISFGPADTGTFIHHVLENFLRERVLMGNAFEEAMSLKDIEAEIDRITEEYYDSVCGSDKIKTGRLSSEFKRLKRAAALTAEDVYNEFTESLFRPACFELEIADKDGAVSPLSVDIGGGRRIKIKGFADRVDTYEKDGKTYVRVVDYKTGGKDFLLSDVKMGLSLQMLMYLYSVCLDPEKKLLDIIGKDKDTELVPAGVIYCRGKSAKPSLSSSASAAEAGSEAKKELDRKGVVLNDPDILTAMTKSGNGRYLPGKRTKENYYLDGEGFDALLCELKDSLKKICNDMYGGRADADPIRNTHHNDCEHCPMKPICRKERYE
ncbi:MAG: hypothetical protein E7623_04865 [Ruminococcaceae bacterium]|nr:hypothetical protein [Oscillospiraceae bacterium]